MFTLNKNYVLFSRAMTMTVVACNDDVCLAAMTVYIVACTDGDDFPMT
jgi:hypothetical protein